MTHCSPKHEHNYYETTVQNIDGSTWSTVASSSWCCVLQQAQHLNHMHWSHSVELASLAPTLARYDANQLALSGSPSDWRPTSTRSARGRSHGTPSLSAGRSVSFSSWSWGPVWPWGWRWPPSCREKPSQGLVCSPHWRLATSRQANIQYVFPRTT